MMKIGTRVKRKGSNLTGKIIDVKGNYFNSSNMVLVAWTVTYKNKKFNNYQWLKKDKLEEIEIIPKKSWLKKLLKKLNH